jgi:GNAT superfamily N-acetyltransferase
LITHFLGRDEVAAYCRDLARRLVLLGSESPQKWFPVGQSGEKIAEVVYGFLPQELKDKIYMTTVYCERGSGEVRFEDSIADVQFGDETIFLIDSAVHSGATMKKVSDHFWSLGVKEILSYTLMLKRSSEVIPTYFSVLVAEKDRVFFQLDEMPNNRLCERAPFGTLREVTKHDVNLVIEEIGPPFEGATMGGLLYDQQTKNYHPYIYLHRNKVCGFVSFSKKRKTLFIDAWATIKEYRGKGIGGALLRWAETWGRSSKCDAVELWAFQDAIPTYLKYHYQFIGEQEMILSATQSYRLMGKKILYNTRVAGYD